MGCLLAKPIVNGIEKDLEGEARLVRLNILHDLGRRIASRYEVRVLPSLVVVNGSEGVVYRHTGAPDRGEVVRLVRSLESPDS